MKTPYLDIHLESLKKLDKNKKISEHGKGLLIELTEIKKQLTTHSVVNWLPFKKENYIKFMEISNKNKLLKKYDDGTILKDGDEEPLAIMTHFAELT